MDGLTYAIPYQKARNDTAQSDFVNFKEDDEESLCIIKDWRARKKLFLETYWIEVATMNKNKVESLEILDKIIIEELTLIFMLLRQIQSQII